MSHLTQRIALHTRQTQRKHQRREPKFAFWFLEQFTLVSLTLSHLSLLEKPFIQLGFRFRLRPTVGRRENPISRAGAPKRPTTLWGLRVRGRAGVARAREGEEMYCARAWGGEEMYCARQFIAFGARKSASARAFDHMRAFALLGGP